MDLIKLSSSGGSPFMNGESFCGHKTIRWTERFREAGEFEVTSGLESGLREFLPLGTFVTHVDTKQVMIVENHEIVQEQNSHPIVKVSGRSMLSILEQRIVGGGYGYGTPASPPTEYVLAAQADPALQIRQLIRDHITSGIVIDPNDALPYTTVSYQAYAEAIAALTLPRGDVYSALTDLLAQLDYGVHTNRRDVNDVIFYINYGEDKTADVQFSWTLGEFESLEYLFTNRKLKNTAYVTGKWVSKMVYTGANGWDRRVMHVEAPDLDDSLNAAPTGGTLTAIQTKMEARGLAALLSQIDLNLTNFQITPDSKYVYRQDYNLGDLVSVRGDFGGLEIRRVTEFTEIEDENGESAHPTLSEVIVNRA